MSSATRETITAIYLGNGVTLRLSILVVNTVFYHENLFSGMRNLFDRIQYDRWGNAASSWKIQLSRIMEKFISVDSVFSIVRFTRRVMLWSTAFTVKSIQTASAIIPIAIPSDWKVWADERQNAILQAQRWGWTEEAVSAEQIF